MQIFYDDPEAPHAPDEETNQVIDVVRADEMSMEEFDQAIARRYASG